MFSSLNATAASISPCLYTTDKLYQQKHIFTYGLWQFQSHSFYCLLINRLLQSVHRLYAHFLDYQRFVWLLVVFAFWSVACWWRGVAFVICALRCLNSAESYSWAAANASSEREKKGRIFFFFPLLLFLSKTLIFVAYKNKDGAMRWKEWKSKATRTPKACNNSTESRHT